MSFGDEEEEEVVFVLASGTGALVLGPGARSPCEVRSYSPAPGYLKSGDLAPPHLELLAMLVWVTANENLLKPLLDEFRHAVQTVAPDNETMIRIRMILGIPREASTANSVNSEKVN
jgi:hypothetical protein